MFKDILKDTNLIDGNSKLPREVGKIINERFSCYNEHCFYIFICINVQGCAKDSITSTATTFGYICYYMHQFDNSDRFIAMVLMVLHIQPH